MRTLLKLTALTLLAVLAAAPSSAQDAAPRERKQIPRYLWVVSPDGEHVAAAGSDDRLEVWSVSAKRPRCEIETKTRGREGISFVGNSQLATLDWEGRISFWDVESGALVNSFRTGTDEKFGLLKRAMGLAFTVEGDKAAIVHFDKIGILVGDEWQGLAIDASLADVAFAPDGRHLLVITSDECIEYHDLDARLVTDALDSTKRVRPPPLWRLQADRSDLPPGTRQKTELGDVDHVSAQFHPMSKRVIVLTVKVDRATRSSTYRLSAWSMKSGKRKWQLELEDEHASLWPAPDSKELFLSTPTCLRIVSPKTGRTLKEFPREAGEPGPMVLAPDGSVGYGADADGNLLRFAVLAKELPPWDDDADDAGGD